MVSAAGFEPATHALKGIALPTELRAQLFVGLLAVYHSALSPGSGSGLGRMNASAALRAKKTLQSESRGCQSVICFAGALLGFWWRQGFETCLPCTNLRRTALLKAIPKS